MSRTHPYVCGLRSCAEPATHHLTLIEPLDLCERHYQAMRLIDGGEDTDGD